MKKGDKKGQFYLIAAMIMIIIITLFAVIFNFSEKSDVSKLKELGEQLSIESEKVLDYDTYNGENEIETFTQEFSLEFLYQFYVWQILLILFCQVHQQVK